jgi:hypothetical protein
LTTFLALYRGESVNAAKLIAVTAEPSLVSELAARILSEPGESQPDPVLQEIESGRRRALQLVRNEAD